MHFIAIQNMEKDKQTKIDKKNKNFKKFRLITGIIVVSVSIIFFVAFASFLMNWQVDESQLSGMWNKKIVAENALGQLGNYLGSIFIGYGVGFIALLLPALMFFAGIRIAFNLKLVSLKKFFLHSVFFLWWTPILMALITDYPPTLFGVTGFEVTDFLTSLIGKFGVGFLLGIALLIYLLLSFKKFFNGFSNTLVKSSKEGVSDIKNAFGGDLAEENPSKTEETLTETNTSSQENKATDNAKIKQKEVTDEELEPVLTQTTQSSGLQKDSVIKAATPPPVIPAVEEPEYLDDILKEIEIEEEDLGDTFTFSNSNTAENIEKHNILAPMEVEVHKEEVFVDTQPKNEEEYDESLSERLVSEYGEYDPTLDLPKFQFPSVDFLRAYDNEDITIDQNELEANKNKIVETLSHYNIGIAKIKATVGPTITLYEIVPEAGIRISKIKNLEDDIALSLSALGIRIIAPIPGKGTIGIEVPNKNPRVVSMRSVVATEKFLGNKNMALPVVFGKTISNETFVVDLAKMPHLLMAGATGQGKSVGLNAVIASLLYKKHPSELKFVLVDPKKVELTLYNKIERHYLAKLPDSDEAIITDNTKVINTLNSLCIEMDNRYELLKDAMVRNLIEYNEKFKQRKLNPNDGHRFLPYIVVIIDEFADLIMTAGKEVETPVARLAQLARAIGIHLIVATQRPSVNVITGIIKANFPSRVAFRVTSKIDSRTILDAGGADQLIGRGDMLYSTGNEIIRLQCAFVDTPEVEKICDFIGNQKGYPDAMHLPEYVGEQAEALDIDLDDRDKMFDEAARLVVASQQGSASLLQRKMKLGYNRAGRIIDQLEAAGIVGPFEGSKARQVLIQDENSLNQILNGLK